MNLLQADIKLKKLNLPYLTTREVSAYLGISTVYASLVLKRLLTAGCISKLARGRWIFKKSIDPFLLPEYLTEPSPSYVSFHSALYHHQIISQIPGIVYAASLARTKRYTTETCDISVHHLDPTFFFGFEVVGQSQIKMAIPEKAVIDYLYLFSAKSKLFRSLPEVELPKDFNVKLCYQIIKKISSKGRRTMVLKLFNKMIAAL